MCVAEWITQAIVTAFALLPVYIAVIVTLVLCVQLFGLPWDW